MKRLLTVTFAIAALVTAVSAQARGEKRGGFLHGRHLKEVLKELNLTEEQQTKFKEIRKSHKADVMAKRESVKGSMKALREIIQSGATKEVILAKYTEVESARSALGRARLGLMLDVRELLTPEQRKQFGELLEKKRPKSEHDE